MYPSICVLIFEDFAAIVQVLSLTSLILCAYLVFKGKTFPETNNDPLQNVDKPLPYLFYRGIELHPRLLGVDIKQVSNTKKIRTFSIVLLKNLFVKDPDISNCVHS